MLGHQRRHPGQVPVGLRTVDTAGAAGAGVVVVVIGLGTCQAGIGPSAGRVTVWSSIK